MFLSSDACTHTPKRLPTSSDSVARKVAASLPSKSHSSSHRQAEYLSADVFPQTSCRLFVLIASKLCVSANVCVCSSFFCPNISHMVSFYAFLSFAVPAFIPCPIVYWQRIRANQTCVMPPLNAPVTRQRFKTRLMWRYCTDMIDGADWKNCHTSSPETRVTVPECSLTCYNETSLQ